MIARECAHTLLAKHGKTSSGNQRYRCSECGKTFTESTKVLDGMRIDLDRAELILNMLLEGMSIRACSRLTNTDPHTIIDLVLVIGERCKAFSERELVNLRVGCVEADEVWACIGSKRSYAEARGLSRFQGDVYCFTAMDRNTKLLITWHLGSRTGEDTNIFCKKLAHATWGKFQITTDGFKPYSWAIPLHFRKRKVDFAQIIKVRQKSVVCSKEVTIVMGHPKEDLICTSFIERHNLTMRMSIKRMARKTICLSKKIENHEAALALFFVWYNFCRVHQTIKTTPAVKHGIAEKPWTVRDLMTNT